MKTPDEKELLVLQAYALIGHAASSFATLEFQLQFLLGMLVSGKALSPEVAILMGNNTFAEKIRVLKEMAILRIPKGSPLRDRMSKLVHQLNSLRNTRNKFIHGCWLVNYPLVLSTGGVTCSDPKCRFNEKEEEWRAMKSESISLKHLETTSHAIRHAIDEIHAITGELERGLKQRKTQTH